MALGGVALVELLLAAGLRPLSPISLPGFGLVVATAFYGGFALAAGAAVTVGYYLINALAGVARFPEFFASPHVAVGWLLVLMALGGVVLWLRRRLVAARRSVVRDEALRESEARLRLIADNLPALVGYVDATERYRFNNSAYEKEFGMPRERMLGRTVREILGEDRYRLNAPDIARALRGERVNVEYCLPQSGVERHMMVSYVPDFASDGAVRGFFVMATEVTQLVVARDELAAARERLENALGGSSAALWDADLRTGRVYLSEAWAGIVGGPPGDTITTFAELFALAHPDDVEGVKRQAVETMKGQRASYAIEHRVRTAAGEWRWVLSRGRVTERDLATGRAQRMIGTNLDITDRKRVEEALQSAAHSDPLTGLANRMALNDRMRVALARGRRSGAGCALLYLDIDRFKQVNDTLGHAAGDSLLRDFAARLRECVRQSDTVARLGGDEFVVLLEDLKEDAAATRVAEKMLESARQPVLVEGRPVTVSTSIGIAFGAEGEDGAAWLKRADAALYQAKSAGRDRCQVG